MHESPENLRHDCPRRIGSWRCRPCLRSERNRQLASCRSREQSVGGGESGEIETMRPVLESNELKPMVTAAYVEDPIEFWKKASTDGAGRDVLAAMLNVIASGYVRVGQGRDEMYVWPYFAEIDLATLTPSQEAAL